MGHNTSTTYTFDEITTDGVSDCSFTLKSNMLSMSYARECSLLTYLSTISPPKKYTFHIDIIFTGKDNLKFELYTRTFLNKYDCYKLAEIVFKIFIVSK